MIELNLTYEESKKILQLGYDFEKVCDRFIEELSRLKKPEYIEQECFQITVFRAEINQRMSDYLIPIIPKDALAKCLPDINPSDNERLPNLDTRRLKVSKYHIDMCDREHEETVKQFNSAFEAFIWCQEHYPEELKKKFSEVMG